jgi:hypothetical protein
MDLDPGPQSKYSPPGRDLKPVVVWIVLGALVAGVVGAGSCIACVGLGSAEMEEAGTAGQDRER